MRNDLAGSSAMEFEPIEVVRGMYGNPSVQFGPLPGFRDGDALAYEWALPPRFAPWPGRSLVERTFVLLDVGVSFSNPCWSHERRADGSVVRNDPQGRTSWYVDLVSVEQDGSRFVVRDLYSDVMVPTDGRAYRILDLDEYADALADGTLSLADAVDGLRRWQRFLDRHLHSGRWPPAAWPDFPPEAIWRLAALPGPFAAPLPVAP